MWVRKSKITLRKSRVYGDMDDVVDTRADLLPLEFYPPKSHVYIEDEKQVYEVVHKYVVVWEADAHE